ncbi:MAG: LysR family transcriptional regulator [Desulforhopalus sp.]
MALNWDDMRFFLALYRRSTFVAAAAELCVTHSTVSRRITALETALQTMLFQRSEKGCTLTPAGERLVVYAEQMESTAINLEESVSGSNSQLSGSIRIGAPDGIGNYYLAACLGRLQSVHRSLDIELAAVPMYYSLSKREIDILITVQKPTVGNVIVRKLTNYRLGMFATPEYFLGSPPVKTRDDLKKHKIIGYIDSLLFDKDLKFMEEISPGLEPQFRSTTVVAQLKAVAAGAGIGVIPYFMAHTEPNLQPVLPEHSIERGYWLQVNPDSRQLARVRATIDFLVREIAKDKDLFLNLPVR